MSDTFILRKFVLFSLHHFKASAQLFAPKLCPCKLRPRKACSIARACVNNSISTRAYDKRSYIYLNYLNYLNQIIKIT